ncbi:MAG: alpha/beta hydrolase [Pseudomonadota bacterium]
MSDQAMSADAGPGNVDPDLRGVIPLLPDFDTISRDNLPEFRALLKGVAVEPGLHGLVQVEALEVPGTPPVPALLYRPVGTGGARPAILNIHGGGFVCGDAAREHDAMLELAAALDCVILSLDYRLAPEHPYPAPADDCAAGLAWLHASVDALSIDPNRIAVRGVSAGGGLAAGLALRARGRADLRICFLLLVYPMLDDRTRGTPHSGQYVWTPAANRFGWASFLASHADDPPAEAVPARATDLSGYPPTFIGVGDIDLFSAENLDFAQALMAAGVPVELHLYPGAYHGFALIGFAQVAQAFERECRAALTRAFAPHSGNDKQAEGNAA